MERSLKQCSILSFVSEGGSETQEIEPKRSKSSQSSDSECEGTQENDSVTRWVDVILLLIVFHI